MAQPPFVPVSNAGLRSYVSPPRRRRSWRADRPGEVVDAGQPVANPAVGHQGPDQGYVLRLVDEIDDDILLAGGEEHADVVAGLVATALKRASAFGRGPVVHDLQAAVAVWGFDQADPPAELVDRRRRLFDGAGHAHHPMVRRAVADAVPMAALHQPLDDIVAAARRDWPSLLGPVAE